MRARRALAGSFLVILIIAAAAFRHERELMTHCVELSVVGVPVSLDLDELPARAIEPMRLGPSSDIGAEVHVDRNGSGWFDPPDDLEVTGGIVSFSEITSGPLAGTLLRFGDFTLESPGGEPIRVLAVCCVERDGSGRTALLRIPIDASDDFGLDLRERPRSIREWFLGHPKLRWTISNPLVASR